MVAKHKYLAISLYNLIYCKDLPVNILFVEASLSATKLWWMIQSILNLIQCQVIQLEQCTTATNNKI